MSDKPEAPTKPDWRHTVFLPKTDFPMKAGLPQKEPLIQAKWEEGDLYAQVRAHRAGREKFILHDGPPYANGDMHIGHALNHILKDMVVRTQTLLGKDAPYVPGWDCHGLPIEWKVEEQYRKKKLNKDEVPIKEFRAECRAYAQHWVDTQREQLKRLGIGGNWDKPYLTMNFEAEGTIVSELYKFAESGQLYRGAKPVMWSPVEKTALAEAEIEYEDVTSTQIDVAFEIVESPIPELVGAHAVVWTTTPWTIPVNQAIAYGPDVEYVALAFDTFVFTYSRDVSEPHPERPEYIARNLAGGRWLVAKSLKEEFERRFERSISSGTGGDVDLILKEVWAGKGSSLAGTLAKHPMAKRFAAPTRSARRQSRISSKGTMTMGLMTTADLADIFGGADTELEDNFYTRNRPFLPGDFVTTDSGTGLVHMAPDHGEDDFELCRAHGIGPQFAVEADGRYRDDWLWLGGSDERRMSVINPKFNAPDGPINNDLREAGALLAASYDYQHSYPHSWRSKAKVIYRCTPQWFIAIDKPLGLHHLKSPAEKRWEGEGGALLDPQHHVADETATLRQLALKAIAETRFVPEKGRNRIGSMVEGRPDWVLSRQRAWGVPIAVFVEKKTGKLLVDHEVNERIVAAIKAEGVDAWEEERAQEYLGNSYNADDYEQVTDILDVWFDSGCTHVFTLESGHWPELRWPADLYLEGSDQHRGWFQSSLLQSCGTRGRAPYNQVLTHGFTMDSKGMKMSKSLGNTISPLDLMRDYGADILRLWALSVDFTEDHRIGKEILAGVGDQYRKLRNTFRYLLGALDGFSEDERIPVGEMPELERYMLHLLSVLDERLRQAVVDYDFNEYVRKLSDFVNEDLSIFYFDIRKDSLYCDAASDPKRRAYRTVLDTLFHALVRWLAPVLVFTSEEVWATRYPQAESVHLLEWPLMDTEWRDYRVSLRWQDIRSWRKIATEHIEPLRREKIIGSSLEAEIEIGFPADPYDREVARLQTIDLAEIFIVAKATARLSASDEFEVTAVRTEMQKCGRCWRHLPEVKEDGDLCARCEEVVNV